MEFIDLKAQYRALQPAIDAGIRKVLEGTRFIGGDEVKELETRLATERKRCSWPSWPMESKRGTRCSART